MNLVDRYRQQCNPFNRLNTDRILPDVDEDIRAMNKPGVLKRFRDAVKEFFKPAPDPWAPLFDDMKNELERIRETRGTRADLAEDLREAWNPPIHHHTHIFDEQRPPDRPGYVYSQGTYYKVGHSAIQFADDNQQEGYIPGSDQAKLSIERLRRGEI